jgi:hypothetical protein
LSAGVAVRDADAEFVAALEGLRAILARYAPRLTTKVDDAEQLYLDAGYSERFKREMFFGAVKRQKRYVSYYLMPVYVFPELLDGMSPALRARMQGKSCFNFRRPEAALFEELADLTRRGFERFEADGLVPGS